MVALISAPAHVLRTTTVPGAVRWALAAGIVAGLVAGVFARGRGARVAGWGVSVSSLIASSVIIAVAPSAPSAPSYTISLAAPRESATVTSPVAFTVCARDASGRAVSTPDGSNVLAVRVDGIEVAAEHTSVFAVPMAAGARDVSVELLTGDHRALTPELVASVRVTVAGTAPLGPAASCAG